MVITAELPDTMAVVIDDLIRLLIEGDPRPNLASDE